jgi:hypothetical protein
MPSQENLEEARTEAQAILKLGDANVADLFFTKAMRRNLSRTVRHLDRLVECGGPDRELGERALERLGFNTKMS